MVDYEVPEEYWTTREIIEDIRLRMIHAPIIVGDDTRALPPVDWERLKREEAEQAEWDAQFEADVRKESLAKRIVKKIAGQ